MSCTVHGKHLAAEKLANSVNCEPFNKIFLANSYRCTKNWFGICTDCSLFDKFSSPIAFTCIGRQIFLTKYFLCTVYILHREVLVKGLLGLPLHNYNDYRILLVNSHGLDSHRPQMVATYYKVENYKFMLCTQFQFRNLGYSPHLFLPQIYSSHSY